MFSYIRTRYTELIILLLIIFNVLDFFKVLPGDLDYTKKIISWVFLGCLFYAINFTWLFFGNHKGKTGIFPDWLTNLILLLLFFAFSMKTIITISASSAHEVVFFHSLLTFIEVNEVTFQIIFFHIGWVGLTLYALYMSFFAYIESTSLLGNLHIYNKPWIIRFIAIFLLVFSFSILVFDLLVEWFVIAVDSLIIMLAIGVYLFLIVKKHKHFNADSLIFRVGNFAENFEEHFLKFFHDKKHVFLGISGLLVLHLLTEIAIFFVPYIFNLTNSYYFHTLGHEPLITQYLSDIALASPIIVTLGYLFNIIGAFMLFILPAYMWYEVYSDKVKMLPKWLTSLTLSSLLVVIVSPLFRIASLDHAQLVGVDIQGISIVSDYLMMTIIAACILFVGLLLLAHLPLLRKLEYHMIMVIAVLFLAYYLFFFYTSTVSYIQTELISAFNAGEYIIFGVFALSLFITIMFLVFGMIKFCVQLFQHHVL